MTEYFVLGPLLDPKNCVIYDAPDDMPDIDYPVEGERVGKTSYQYQFNMAKGEPGIRVADVITNALGYVMISSRFKSVLEQHSSADVEYIPFKLRNHKGRFVPDELFIANVIGIPANCVDLKKTTGDPDPVNKGRYMFIEQLVFDPKKLDAKRDLFRLPIRPQYLVFRDDLKQKIEAAGITGTLFHRVGDEVNLG